MYKGKKKKTKENAITLIALVVTIIVLLILSGVSIVVLFGDNGILKAAEDSALQTKLVTLEEKANIMYADLNTKKYAEGNSSKVITMADIKAELEKEKYKLKQIQLSENAITGIELEPTTIKLGKGETATIDVIFQENNEKLAYYVEVDERYYQIRIENGHITIDKTNGKAEEELEKNENTDTLETATNNNIVEVIEKTENTIKIKAGDNVGTTKITVTYGSLTPKICEVTVAIKPIEGNTDLNTNIITNYGRIDVLWLDENNNIIPEPKAPILGEEGNKMKPIRWNGTTEEPANETNENNNWYHYKEIEGGGIGSELPDNTTSHWANAKTENGSYFVWIPRYAYRITYYEDETSTSPTGYYDGYGMWNAEDGKKKCNLEQGIETVENTEGDKYIVHPAFGTTKTDQPSKTQNIDLGGWDRAITGFWFAKFEMSENVSKTLASVPGVKSQRNKTIGEYYTKAREAIYGQIGKVDSFDNKTSFMNSHMIKNSEWGAVAYLTHSKYGRNGHEITMNGPEDLGTGGGSNSQSYTETTNQSQSTTGNVYGIYDMSAGAYEYTAAWNTVGNASYIKYGNSFAREGETSTKYATAYSSTSSQSNGSIIYQVSKTGDAIKEVSKGWFGDYNNILYYQHPFIRRGGDFTNGTQTGVFASNYDSGEGHSRFSFRTTLIP